MQHKIVPNGLWGAQALDVREFNGGTGPGLYEQIESHSIQSYSGLTVAQIEEALLSIASETSAGTPRTLYTGTRGREIFEEDLISVLRGNPPIWRRSSVEERSSITTTENMTEEQLLNYLDTL